MFNHRVNENIVLRLPNLSDAPTLFALFEENREHLTEWQDWPNAIQTLEDCQAFITRHEREYAEGKTLGCLIIFQDKVVGMCTLAKIVPLLRKAELEYWIAQDYQGQGIVKQACRGLMAYAFGTMNLNRLALKFKRISVDQENRRSRRLAELLGFIPEGVLRQDGMTKGQLMDMVMYSILADEWQQIQAMINRREQQMLPRLSKSELLNQLSQTKDGFTLSRLLVQAGELGILADGSLKGFDFANCDLMLTRLYDFNAPQAIFDYSDLQEIVLKESMFEGASFIGVDLTLANLSGNFRNAILDNANLADAVLEVDIAHGSLINVNLTHALIMGNWENTNLTGANLTNAEVSDVNFKNANLTNANLEGIRVEDFKSTTILPDGNNWFDGVDWERFTNPAHVDFWTPEQGD